MTESNFHKWNESIYYEIINIICNNEGIKYNELLQQLDKYKAKLHCKDMSNGEYHWVIQKVVVDLIEHDILEGPLTLGPQIFTPYHPLNTAERIPVGTDLFEYLRDKGVI